MTEEEWLKCDDPRAMLTQRGIFNERQLILFGCACCYRHRHLFAEPCLDAIRAAEQYADGECSGNWLRAAREVIEDAYPNIYWTADFPNLLPHWAAWLTAFDIDAAIEFGRQHPLESDHFVDMFVALKYELSESVVRAVDETGRFTTRRPEHAVQSALLRDVIGNPFRPVTPDPEWLTSTVTALASQMYESRDFSAMPILADALQDAGCDNADVLNHCRDAGATHVRGCWVVDLVLGKS